MCREDRWEGRHKESHLDRDRHSLHTRKIKNRVINIIIAFKEQNRVKTALLYLNGLLGYLAFSAVPFALRQNFKCLMVIIEVIVSFKNRITEKEVT